MNVILILASFHTDDGLSEDGKERVKHVASILEAEPSSMAIVTGGKLAYGQAGPHHSVVSEQLSHHGVKETRILATLTDTRHTVDEAFETSKVLESTNYESLYVVTSFVHYPRAPFIFAHFFELSRLHFILVPDRSAKDVTRFNHLHEAEAFQEDRRRGGVILHDGRFLPTDFQYSDFTELLRNRTDLRLPGMRENELDITKDMNLFEHYDPNSPYQQINV